MNFIGVFNKESDLVFPGENKMDNYHVCQVDGAHEHFSTGTSEVVFSGKLYDWTSMKSLTDPVYYSARLFNLLTKNGIDSVTSLDGQFISIIDTPASITILRDYFGSGSQVYYNDVLFSNSMKLIKESGLVVFEPEKLSLVKFLKEGFIAAPNTAIKGLRKLGPGEYLVYDKTTKKVEVNSTLSYNEFSKDAGSLNLSLADAVKYYEELHRKSILKRIKGHKEVGVLLSGGFDSGGNISVLRELFQGDITAYSAGFEDNPWSELPYAAMMAKQFGAKHEVHYLNEADLEALPEIVQNLGDPFFENGLMLNYKITNGMSQSRPSVVLGGDGNDQMFGTSGRELALLSFSRKTGMGFVQNSLNSITDNTSGLFRLAFHNKNILLAPYLKEFGFSGTDLQKILGPAFNGAASYRAPKDGSRSLKDFDDLYLWRNFNSDIMQSAGQVIVYKAAQIAKMYDLNVTFPYLDKEIFDFLQKLPRDLKYSGTAVEAARGKGKSKFLFKKYLHNKLPSEITKRKKQGGFAPLAIFLKDKNTRDKMYAFIESTLTESGLFNHDDLNQFAKKVEAAVENPDLWFWYKQSKFNQLFNLLILSIWWKQFMCYDIRQTLTDYLGN
jgi:asparagine synthase (glutamine-hydrolysing)